MEKIKYAKKKKSYQYIVNKYIDCIFCFFVFLIESNLVKMSRIQLPYGEVEVIDKNRETAKLDLPKNYRASEYFRFCAVFP